MLSRKEERERTGKRAGNPVRDLNHVLFAALSIPSDDDAGKKSKRKKNRHAPKTVLGLPPLFRCSSGGVFCCCSSEARRLVRPAMRWATSGEAERGSSWLEVVVVSACGERDKGVEEIVEEV